MKFNNLGFVPIWNSDQLLIAEWEADNFYLHKTFWRLTTQV